MEDLRKEVEDSIKKYCIGDLDRRYRGLMLKIQLRILAALEKQEDKPVFTSSVPPTIEAEEKKELRRQPAKRKKG